MPICENCNQHFPNSKKIEGKWRNLQKRKYCLECSPFGLHNTRPIEERYSKQDIECVCGICGRKYIYSYDKNKKRAVKGHSKKYCNSCKVNRKRITIKIKAIKYKGGKCIRCGYDKYYEVLEFHHLDPNKKEFTICNSYHYSWERLKKELDKCDLLCSNCHREIHANDNMTRMDKYKKYQIQERNMNENLCIDCGKKCAKNVKRCQKCYNIKRRKVEWPSKEELAENIKRYNWCALGRMYNVTDNAVRKWARHYQLL